MPDTTFQQLYNPSLRRCPIRSGEVTRVYRATAIMEWTSATQAWVRSGRLNSRARGQPPALVYRAPYNSGHQAKGSGSRLLLSGG